MVQNKSITIEATINAPIEKVWACWTAPEHITQWAFASPDWEAPAAENDVRVGGRFKTRMAAKDKSSSFDFTGVYTKILPNHSIEYDMDRAPGELASRHVSIEFFETAGGVRVVETFDLETENPEAMQRSGWQAILNNFKQHVESH